MSLSTLVTTNRKLIRSASFDTDEPASILPTDEEGALVVPDEEEEKEPEFKGFSATDKLTFEQVVAWVGTNTFGGNTSGKTTIIDAFVNGWAEKWRTEQGLSSTDDIDRVPSLDTLLSDEDFLNGATWLPLTAAGQLPPLFTTGVTGEDGETQEVVAVTSPLTGVEFKTITQVIERKTASDAIAFNRLIRSNSDLARRLFKGALDVGIAGNIPTPGGGATVTHVGDRGGEGIRMGGPNQPTETPAVPDIAEKDLIDMYVKAVGGDSGGGGGGGGGTSTTREIVFDRDQLVEQVSNLWKTWFLEDPDLKRIDGVVDGYIREARAFWNTGGKLDFDTYVRNNLRNQPRYSVMFARKPGADTEEQFIARYRQPIGQFGLEAGAELEQTRAAIQSGGSPTEQVKRISRTRDVQTQNQGGFSQRLAQTLGGLGLS